jgi:hypothetical protein
VPSSSAVEQSAVNRPVVGSIPTLAVLNNIMTLISFLLGCIVGIVVSNNKVAIIAYLETLIKQLKQKIK